MRYVALALCACSSATGAPPATGRAEPVSRVAPVSVSPPAPIGNPAVVTAITAVRIAAAVDHGAATDRPTYARADQRVTLYAVLEVGHTVFSDAPALVLDGHKVTSRPLSAAPAATLAWQRVEPAAASYSNTDEHDANFHYEPIEYRATPIANAAAGSLAADVRPTLTPDHGDGVGTMRYQLVAQQRDHTTASAGPEARRGRGSGGLTDAVMRVSIRRDDTYLGYLTEMFGQPYVWASAGASDATHQSERLEGADCADFVVYGARRAGKHIAYTWTGGLPAVTSLLAAGTRGDDGVYRDAHGRPVRFPRVGDLVLFPRHVGALVEDRGVIGVLDDQDLMMHALFDTPKVVPIAESGYADKPVELRRFR